MSGLAPLPEYAQAMTRRLQVLEGCCKPIASSVTDSEAKAFERLLRAVADRHRIRLVNILANSRDAVCVCDLVPALGLAQPTVSYHLKQLTDAGIIARERRGTYSYYRIVPGALEELAVLFEEPRLSPLPASG
jgi:ArsR family transcriptional regulator, arsenate/arsenite/antimonite-responsive transcriptional repressor